MAEITLLVVSFDLELHAPITAWDHAERAAAATADPGHVKVVPGRRKRWGRSLKPTIHFDWKQGQEVLSDDADWSEVAFSLSEEGRQNLSRTVLALAGVLEPGWGIRAYWEGDPLKQERTLSARELVELVQRSALDRCTLYRVG